MILADFTPIAPFDRELILKLKETLSNITLNNRRDEVKWRCAHSKKFFIKSLYNFLHNGVKVRSFAPL